MLPEIQLFKRKFKTSAAAMLNFTGSSNAHPALSGMMSFIHTYNLVRTCLTILDILGCLDICRSSSFDQLECIQGNAGL